ncbi:MAG: LacI family DNA-binding transcriptional regulator [Deinococcota bacterium]
MTVKRGANKTKGRVTLKDVARELGVAASTVSNAYNRPDQLSPALRDSVLQTAERLGYLGPDPTARSLRRGVTNTIGLVYPSPLSYTFTDPIAGLFVQGIALEVERQGYTLLLVGGEVDDDVSAQRSTKPTLATATTVQVDGFIVHCFASDDPVLEATLTRGLPIVMVDHHIDQHGNEAFSSVKIEDELGAKQAANHVLEHGHSQFGIISLEMTPKTRSGLATLDQQAAMTYTTTKIRLEGYRRAIERAGLDWETSAAVYETADNTPAEGELAAASLLAQTPQPTAILAMSDQLALGALTYIKRQGLDVPADVSVVGFDDMPGSIHASPPLTTVRQPHVDKGKHAGKLLLAQLQGDTSLASVTLPTKLIVRGSSGPAPQS